MKKTIDDRDDAIPILRTDAQNLSPHNKEQLRKRLLQMIVRSEAERRSIQTPAETATKPRWRSIHENSAKLNVFDPDDLIGRESAGESPQRRA
jgi:hypothetical protein